MAEAIQATAETVFPPAAAMDLFYFRADDVVIGPDTAGAITDDV